MKKYLVIALSITVGLISCHSNKDKKYQNDSDSIALQIEDGLSSADDKFQSYSPRILERNREYGLVLLNENQLEEVKEKTVKIDENLPVIGLLMFDGVLTTELTAPMDVFTKHTEDGKKLFNVITIADSYDFIVSEEGLKMFPDYTVANSPQLDILIVPSAYDMALQTENQELVNFIKAQNSGTEYTVSNCAGATLIGESGIADGMKIVTWIGCGKDLQKNYPKMLVQNDAEVSYMEDGKLLSSNGNLASYISSLELLEKMTNPKHREYVESLLYLDRLKKWEK